MKRGISCPREKVQPIPGCPILRAFCEGWDTTNLDTDCRVSHPLQRTQRTRISYYAAPAMAACAAFFKESRMRFVDPTKPYRKSGGWGTRLFVALPAVPNTIRRLIENLFLISHSGVIWFCSTGTQ
jgi:hypothetical protein